MTGRPSLGVVVVNHRRYDLLEACIRTLRDSRPPPDRIVVVDNDTTPDLLARCAPDAPDLVALGNLDNRGYAAACNQGWWAAGTDVVVFLNADVTVAPDCLARCLAVLEADPSVGIVTGRLDRPDGTFDHACHRGLPTLSAGLWYALRLHRLRPASRRFGRYTMSWLDHTSEHDVEACSGAFMMLRRATLEQVGGWDEGYWFYGEDLDLCARVQAAGLRVRYVGSARAIHVKGASSSIRRPDAELDERQLRTKRQVRRAIVASHRRYYRHHLAPGTPRLVRPLVELWFGLQQWRLDRGRPGGTPGAG